jgi:hypothetical protein
MHKSHPLHQNERLVVASNWWETSSFGGSNLPFGFLLGKKGGRRGSLDLELGLAGELLTGERKSYVQYLAGTRKNGLGSACLETPLTWRSLPHCMP